MRPAPAASLHPRIIIHRAGGQMEFPVMQRNPGPPDAAPQSAPACEPALTPAQARPGWQARSALIPLWNLTARNLCGLRGFFWIAVRLGCSPQQGGPL